MRPVDPPWRRAGTRVLLCTLTYLALAFGYPAVVYAAVGDPGTVRIEQRSSNGGPANGGCYTFTQTSGDEVGNTTRACDHGSDAVVIATPLSPGGYEVEETDPPTMFKPAPGKFSLAVGDGQT